MRLCNLRYSLAIIIFCVLPLSAQNHFNETFYDEDSGLSQWHVTQMLQDHNGMMWFSTWNGLNRFDGSDFVCFKPKAGEGCNMPTDRIRDMILARNNDIYCLVDEQWYCFSRKTGKFYDLTNRCDRILNSWHRRPAKFHKGSNGVLFSMRDRQGNIWEILRGGILKRTPFSSPVKKVSNLGKPSQIRAFFRDKRGHIWISSKENKCVYEFDSHLRFIRQNNIQASAYCMGEDDSGQLYYGCKPEGLLTYNFQGRLIGLWLPENDIYDIEPEGNTLWLATFGGIYKVNLLATDRNWQVWKGTEKMKVRKILVNGDIVIAATTEGLFIGNWKTKHFILHQKEADRSSSLSSSACMNILEHQGHIFVCTESGGVNEIISRNLEDRHLEFRHFDESNGLSSDVAISMTSLGKNILVVGSNQLMILDPSTGRSRSFGKHFLHRSCRFSDAVPLRLNDGRWIFGLQDGAFTIPESQLLKSSYSPNLVLTGLTIENKEERYEVDWMKELTLDSDERSITLKFAALDFIAPDYIKYAYRLAGDRNWHFIGNSHSISLPELKPGKYLLELQSTNSVGAWSGNIRKLSIIVTPKFTETIWFDILLILLILAITGGGVYTYYYIERIKRQQKETLEAYLALLDNQKKETNELKKYSGLSEADDQLMKRVMAFVEENISNSDAGVGEMAEAAMVSRSGLTRKMKEVVGITPADFLREARIKRAAEMLKTTDKTVSEVAYECGFTDPKYFSRCFKNSMNCTPTTYREQ